MEMLRQQSLTMRRTNGCALRCFVCGSGGVADAKKQTRKNSRVFAAFAKGSTKIPKVAVGQALAMDRSRPGLAGGSVYKGREVGSQTQTSFCICA